VHNAIDDATRPADAEVLPDEKATTAIGFLRRAITFFERHGMRTEFATAAVLPLQAKPEASRWTLRFGGPSAWLSKALDCLFSPL
jgi:hypothetical protein